MHGDLSFLGLGKLLLNSASMGRLSNLHLMDDSCRHVFRRQIVDEITPTLSEGLVSILISALHLVFCL